MAKYSVTGPDGQKYTVTAPDDATDEQIMAYVQQSADKKSAMGGGPAQKGTKQPGLREAGASMPTAARGFINAAQGPLFNFADEIAAGGAAVVDRVTGRNPGFTLSDLYTRYRDVARGASESYQKENPIAAPLTQAGASMATLGPLGMGGAPAAGPASAITRAAMIGGAQGALGGAGGAQEMSDIPADAALSGAFGTLTGGVLSGVQQAGSATLRNMAARASNTRTGQRTASDLARERVATAIVRDTPDALTQNPARAAQYPIRKITRLGDDAVIADSAGRNTRELLDTVSNMPGRSGNQAEQLVRSRQNLRFSRLEGAAERGLQTSGRRLSGTVEDLVEQRATAAAPLYERVRQIAVPADARLSDLVQRSKDLGADKIARTIATARGLPYTLDDDLAKGAAARLSMRDLDHLKEGLDDLISKQIKPDGSISRQGRALMDLRKDLLTTLDGATTPRGGDSLYKAARDAFSGPTALIDAAEKGKRAMVQDAETLRGITSGMTQSELDAFRVGAFEALRNKIGTQGGQTELLKFYSNKNMQERLRVLFPDIKGYNDFKREVTREIVKRRVEGVVGGSQTFSRGARQDDEAAALLEGAAGVASAAKGGILAPLAAARKLGTRASMPEPVRDEIGRLLMQRGPQAQQTLGDLSRYLTEINARRGAVANELGLLGGSSINALIGN